ncbi:uncharacterized protein LOC142629096 [Castanea sativa]|uniref:uncharacterized protein LOC142629096 n=1 Tax=Castanea sativa TaxID=21020 RepID=UPI003F64EFE0
MVLHAFWSCREVDAVWSNVELWGLWSSIQFGEFKELENKAGASIAIRNREGFLLASQSRQLNQAYRPSAIKAIVALRSLQLAMKLGFAYAILERDSLTLMSSLQNESEIMSPDGQLIEDFRRCSSSFHQLRYSHTKREGNKVVHCLARYALNISEFVVWVEYIPPLISFVLQANLANSI